VILQAFLVILGALALSFAAAGLMVFVIARLVQRVDRARQGRRLRRPDLDFRRSRHLARRLLRRDPPWWAEFERGFEDYVRTHARHES